MTKPDDSGMVGNPCGPSNAKECRRRRGRKKSRAIRAAFVTYRFSINRSALSRRKACLVDRGANGCIIGSDMTLVERTDQFIDLTGIEDHTVRALNIVHAAFVAKSHLGYTIFHVYQGAYMPDGKSILSPLQLEANQGTVLDKAKEANEGKQPYVQSPDGYCIPMAMRQGLMYIDIRPVRESEWESLPHCHLTSDQPWDPSIFDHEVDPDWEVPDPEPVQEYYANRTYDRFGNIEDATGESAQPMGNTELEAHHMEETTTSVQPEEPEAQNVERSTNDAQPVSRAQLEANFTESISRELMDSMIEIDVDGEKHYKEFTETDTVYNWGDWQSRTLPNRFSYDVEGRVLRKRTPVNYKATADRKKRNPSDKGNPTAQSQQTKNRRSPRRAPTDHATNPPKVETVLEDDDDISEPRTDYNNPAKTTDVNEERKVEGGPYVGKPSKIDFEKYRKNFCGAPVKVIEETFKNTTQLGRIGAVKGLKLWKRHKAPNPALNVPRRNEPVATDTIYGPGCPAVDNGSTAAQFFVGRKSGFCAAEGLGSSDKKYPQALLNHIRRYGAMDEIVSDNAQAQQSLRVEEILNMLMIKFRSSEAYNKNQNFAERIWQMAKRMVEITMNSSDAPAFVWLLCLDYICFVLNHTSQERLGGRTPTEWLLGYTPDITVLLCFTFWEPVYYAVNEASFPAESEEALGRFVGIADVVGNTVSFKILTENMKVITRSVVRTATKGGVYQNLRANSKAPKLAPHKSTNNLKLGDQEVDIYIQPPPPKKEAKSDELPLEPGEKRKKKPDPNVDTQEAQKTFLTSAIEAAHGKDATLPTIEGNDILGRTFISTPDENGEQFRTQIVDVELLQDRTADGAEPLLRFKCKAGNKRFEEIMTYNRMLDWCNQDALKDGFFEIVEITNHKKNRHSKGGWDVLVTWGSGTTSWNQLGPTIEGDPVTVAMYAQKNNLLNEPGFKHLKRYTKREKVLGRLINQMRLKNFRNKPRYKYGYQVPRNHEEAVMIDEREGNTKWQDSEHTELEQLWEYETFRDLGKDAPIPSGYKKIPCHMVYDVKHDGRHKSRFVAGGHRTDTPIESTYSAVVSLLGVRMVTFLAELNDLELWGTDIGNAYLESYTSEKVCFKAGAEFGKYAGHTLVIVKAQYGLKSSGKCWHDRLHDVLRSMGFFPSKAEEDIWMRDADDHYEYICVYVDDLLIASKKPQAIIDQLTAKPHSFKLKGTGPVKFHLGCDYFRDENNTLCAGPRKYIERMEIAYKNLFGSAPSQKVQSPLEKNDHPELDDSPLLEADGIAKYQSLIGTLQWTISLGRFDIATAVMTMSSFRAAPREGHLERLKRICGYLSKFRTAVIRFRTEEPDYSDLPKHEYDWSRSVYRDSKYPQAEDAPEPKGKYVTTTTYKDANLYHDLMTGKACTAVLHFLNQTPIDWYTKKQATVETATYGSEFAAARTAIQQIIGLRQALQYLGVPLRETSYLFGDNESVVKSGSIPHSTLSKRHHALAYHFTREAVATGLVSFYHIDGDKNPSDILSKHWGHSQVYPMLRPLLFYQGDTADLIDEDETVVTPKEEETDSPEQEGSDKIPVPQSK